MTNEIKEILEALKSHDKVFATTDIFKVGKIYLINY